MPPLPSNPEIIHAQPGTDEFAGCMEQFRAGEVVATVVNNNGNLNHFFLPAGADKDFIEIQVVTAGMASDILEPPMMMATTFLTYEKYERLAAAADIDTGAPPHILEGIVENVVDSVAEPNPKPKGLGVFSV